LGAVSGLEWTIVPGSEHRSEGGRMDEVQASYKEFAIHPRPRQCRDDESCGTMVQIQRDTAFRPVTAKNSRPTEERAIKGCIELGRRVIDGDTPGMSVDELRAATSCAGGGPFGTPIPLKCRSFLRNPALLPGSDWRISACFRS
jgi:hypothetical protein